LQSDGGSLITDGWKLIADCLSPQVPMRRFILFAVALLAVFTAAFLVAQAQGWTEPAFVEAKLKGVRESPQRQWLSAGAVVGLLAADLVLPIPSSVVMTFSGLALGTWRGGAASFCGAMLAAAVGFYACRWGGRSAFMRMIGGEETDRVEAWFRRFGLVAVVLSRPVPMLTEVLSCLAGLSGVGARAFFLASAAGTLPLCLVYAYCGSRGDVANPWPPVLAAAVIPAIGWMVVKRKF
jgi:uncharacterized membrane protein YdjX (TVP38/TMEM64 family)